MPYNSAIQVLAASIVLCAAVPSSAAAQDVRRTITGTVLDSASNKPVAGVEIYLDGTAMEERTAKNGTFRVQAGTAEASVLLRRPGFVPALVKVPAGSAGSDSYLGVTHIRQVKTDADRAAVQAADIGMFPQLAPFYERKARFRGGAFLTPDELRQTGGSLTDLIRQRQGFRDMCVSTRRGELDCGKKSDRGPSTIYGTGTPALQVQQLCLTRIWFDEVGPERSLEEIAMKDVLAIEAYPSVATTPNDLPGSPCATIMLWMRTPSP